MHVEMRVQSPLAVGRKFGDVDFWRPGRIDRRGQQPERRGDAGSAGQPDAGFYHPVFEVESASGGGNACGLGIGRAAIGDRYGRPADTQSAVLQGGVGRVESGIVLFGVVGCAIAWTQAAQCHPDLAIEL